MDKVALRHLGFRLSIIFVTLVITLLVIEVVCQLFWKHISGELIPLSLEIHRQSSNPELVFELIPNSSVAQDGVMYTINGDGLRDSQTYSLPKSENFRVAAVGDSFTFGMALPLKDTWPKQLEKIIQSKSDLTSRVYNFGIMGYDTIQEIELIKSKVLPYKPDLIVIGYCLNDVGVFSRERSEVNHYKGYHQYLKTGCYIIDSLLNHSKLFRFIKDRLFLYQNNIKIGWENMDLPHDVQEAVKKGYSQYLYELYRQPDVIKKLKRNMQALHEIGLSSHIPVVVCLFPEIDAFKNYIYYDAHQLLMNIINESGLYALDFFPAFRQFPPQKIRISKSNHHPNARGNNIAAKEIYRFITEHHILDVPKTEIKQSNHQPEHINRLDTEKIGPKVTD